jgi:acyl-coenzyme A synthetase/AMP-(fatty) acid ligase
VVFGGFAAKELATRIEDAKPKLIFSASCGNISRRKRDKASGLKSDGRHAVPYCTTAQCSTRYRRHRFGTPLSW